MTGTLNLIRLIVVLLALALAWPPFASAEPISQTAFRDLLVKFDREAEDETDIGRLRALEAERAAELAKVLSGGLRFDGWQLVLSGSEATPIS